MSEMAEAIKELVEQKGLSAESVMSTIESMLKAAYKRTYGTNANAVVVFEKDENDIPVDVTIYSRKEVIDGGEDIDDVFDPVTEVPLGYARKLSPDCEIGDELDIPEDPKTFERSSVSTGKQTAQQGLNESYKDNLYKEYKDKVGGIIIGYYQRERNGTIYVDLGKIEGVLPQKYQSPRETYEKGDRIRAYVADISKNGNGIQLILSRSAPELVRSILETEVPEVADGSVEIAKIVREAGYRTKIAVSSQREDIDPVGACVGLKGVRIQNVIQELLGEKIDVLRYDSNPVVFIKNALSPAEISRVIILDEDKKQALAIASESQFSLAIGKQGLNVRLANRLCDWSIDVKTEEQAAEMDLSEFTSRQNAQNLFRDDDDEFAKISGLPGVDERVADLLKAAGIEDVRQFVDNYDSISVEGVSKEDLEKLNALINENIEFVDEEQSPEQGEVAQTENNAADEEEYFCPECGAKITLDMTHCPKCGVEFEFQEDEE
ncbi:MAG: transcription termination/antitermination protein NusA [Treponema sp.]|nr:transcription termination/antitermination protein NusA [Treponema sp.]